MDFDLTQTDTLLSTTRSVRKRLDLDRPVEREVLLECILDLTHLAAQHKFYLVEEDDDQQPTKENNNGNKNDDDGTKKVQRKLFEDPHFLKGVEVLMKRESFGKIKEVVWKTRKVDFKRNIQNLISTKDDDVLEVEDS